MDDASDFYLDIAGRAAKELVRLKGKPRMKVVPTEEGFRRSSHYRHAVVCTVFSAVAIEHAMKRLMLERVSRTGPPYQRYLVTAWRAKVEGGDRDKFLRGATRIPRELHAEIKRVFDDRNAIMHVGLEMRMKEMKRPRGMRVMEHASFKYPTLREDAIPRALKNYESAKKAVVALRAAIQEEEWWPVGKPWQT